MTMESKPEPDATESSNEIYNFASEKEIQALDVMKKLISVYIYFFC